MVVVIGRTPALPRSAIPRLPGPNRAAVQCSVAALSGVVLQRCSSLPIPLLAASLATPGRLVNTLAITLLAIAAIVRRRRCRAARTTAARVLMLSNLQGPSVSLLAPASTFADTVSVLYADCSAAFSDKGGDKAVNDAATTLSVAVRESLQQGVTPEAVAKAKGALAAVWQAAEISAASVDQVWSAERASAVSRAWMRESHEMVGSWEAWRRESLEALEAWEQAPRTVAAEIRKIQLRPYRHELDVLGLPPKRAATISAVELRELFRTRAKDLHPDAVAFHDSSREEAIRELNAAYEALSAVVC